MGVKGGSKVFQHSGEVKLKDLSDMTIAIDAMTEIYRNMLGMRSVKGLTDNKGRSTVHVMGIMNLVLKMKSFDITQIWVFDHPKGNTLKKMENEERRRRRIAAESAVTEAKKAAAKNLFAQPDLFNDSDEEHEEKSSSVQKHEKRAFRVETCHIDDVKFILNRFGIAWVEAPEGFEAECVCANMVEYGHAEAVLSPDMDTLLFGAETLIRRDVRNKKFYKYSLSSVLEDLDMTRRQLVQVGIVLGTDFYKDNAKDTSKRLFFRIGPKTVVKKIKSGNLEEKFEDPRAAAALEHFMAECPDDIIVWHNKPGRREPFSVVLEISGLIDWLVDEKTFSRANTRKKFRKFGLIE
jgi:flap endonuclease-1